MVRADEERAISRISEPRQRWIDNISRDLEELGVQRDWKSMARDRTKWRGFIEAAKTLEMLFGHRK